MEVGEKALSLQHCPSHCSQSQLKPAAQLSNKLLMSVPSLSTLTQDVQESEVIHPQLPSKLEATLGYVRLCGLTPNNINMSTMGHTYANRLLGLLEARLQP